jgi:ElaB/YqjD/DUF883 family membrane-anchored ribosome-binding protein
MFGILVVGANKFQTMDIQAKTTEKTVLLNMADRLIDTQREIDELTLQLALGKVEVMEKYEDIKREFKYRIDNFRNSLKNHQSVHLYKDMISRLDLLQERLNLDKADSRETFVAQRRFILKSLFAFEDAIRRSLPDSHDVQHIISEIENFKLKLEIVRLRFELKRFVIKDEIKSNADEVRRRVSKLIDKARKKMLSIGQKLIHPGKDIIGKTFS